MCDYDTFLFNYKKWSFKLQTLPGIYYDVCGVWYVFKMVEAEAEMNFEWCSKEDKHVKYIQFGSRLIHYTFTYVSIKHLEYQSIDLNRASSILQTYFSVHYIPGKNLPFIFLFCDCIKRTTCLSSRHRHWSWQREKWLFSFYDIEW